jgi:peptidoglycan/LPS O-acetylase OafA/YrhL
MARVSRKLDTPGVTLDKKIPALDGVRGLAITMVLVFHFTTWANDRAPTRLFELTSPGTLGVDLFFVLSGFLITGILADARGSDGYFKNFYMRRTLRIFPLYYAAVVLVAVIGPLIAPNNQKIAEVTAQQGWLWTYTVNISGAIKNQFTFYGMNHFWSLAVEEQFYLVWPFLVAWLPRERMAKLCVVLMVAALGLRIWFDAHDRWLAVYSLMPCRMDELSAGALAALLLRGPSTAPELLRWSRYAVIAGGIGTALLVLPLHGSLPPHVLLPTTLSALFGGMHVYAVLLDAKSVLRRVLEVSWLRALGRYSYGLYVIHHPLRQLFEKLFPPGTLASVLHSPALGAIAFTLLSGLLSLGFAYVSFRFFESPILNLKRHFEYERKPD